MKKLQLYIPILFLVCLGHFRAAAQGNSVGYGSEFGQPPIWTSAGVGLADGNSVWIGYFDPGFDVLANADDLDALRDAWNLYGATTTYSDVLEPGHFFASASSVEPLTVNQQIWLWVFKTADNSDLDTADPGSDFGDVREYGLFSSSQTTWRYPALGSPPNNRVDINTSQVDIARWGSISGGHLNLAAVAPIPEPAVSGLLALGLLGLVARLRKKN